MVSERKVKADYDEISGVYDQARRLDKPHVAWWLERLAEAGELGPGKTLLDLGCGTGRWLIPLVQRTGCRGIGVDNAPGMLAKAREKDDTGRIEWLVGDVHRPPVPDGSADCALMSLLLHHLEDIPGAFAAAWRALRPGGVLLIRQGTCEQILEDRAHRFFPEAITVDRLRTPFRAEVEHWLAQAGFEGIAAQIVRPQTCRSLADMLEEVDLAVCSVYRLISPEAYAAGRERLRRYVKEHPEDTSLLEDEMTLFMARRPG